MKSTVYQIAQTPVLIHGPQDGPETIYLEPAAQNIFIGASDVTTATGLELTKDVITPIFVRGGQTLYAITATGTHPLVCLCESP